MTLDEVRQLGFDAVVVAVGAQGTKWLGLPGEEAKACFHAKDLVYHYNVLPPFSEQPFAIGRHPVVVGLGNVSMDIVHWLACEKKVASVSAVARRGPGERKFTKKEYKLVSGALDADDLRREMEAVSPQMRSIGQDPEAELKQLLRYAEEPLETESETAFRMRFLRSPVCVEVDDDGQVTGLTCEKTKLLPPDDSGRVGIEGLDEFETIPCDTVIFAIGDSIEPSLGLPLSPESVNHFATVPQPWDAHPERPRYMVYDPVTEEPMWGVFVVGWARKASDGLVGKARADAVQGCDEILSYLKGEFPEGPSRDRSIEELLKELEERFLSRELRVVDYDEIAALTRMEEVEAQRLGVPEFKFGSQAEILRQLDTLDAGA